MLGFFDYTVWLTYMSLLSASLGIMVTLNGGGHPYMGIIFTILFVTFFDATGTLIPLANACGRVDDEGNIDGIERTFLAIFKNRFSITCQYIPLSR